ncbi:MAG: DPP IV N-terminal domain-containing protein [Gemmatimonadota bacterium]|nr:DPP IV N-terminal domain-containing protein [Gemmatimonadota bacterium]
MKLFIGCFIGLVLSVSVGAESLLEGRVRLSSGQPAVGVQVRLFDLTDLRRFVGTTTDESGHFALSLRAFSTDRGTALPTDFVLGQNYPNPFNPSTVIPYQIPASAHVRLEVFNLLGQRLATLVDAEQSAGMHTALWDATDAVGRAVGAGVYIYRLSSGRMTESRRMVLVDGQAGIPTAQGAVRATVQGVVKADGSVYGLTVAGEGLIAYVNPTFRVGVDEADIVIEEHGGMPRMKRTTSIVLGDVNNDGQVDVSDVLYVLLYIMTDSSMILPNNGEISLGDVNKDGTVDLADVLLLVRYTDNPSDPTLPAGIGDDYGDTLSKATEVSLGSSISGSLSADDVDYFVIEISSSDTLIASTTGSVDTEGAILDSSGTVLARDSDSGKGSNFRVSVPVSAGTYYIRVKGWDSDTGDYTLYAQRSSGDNDIATNLTQNADSDYNPAWSPDGQRIVFTSTRGRNSGIYVMSADGSNPTRLTQNAGEDWSDWSPAWSPDGQRIAFVSTRDGNSEIYVMSADGSNPTNLTQDVGDDYNPAWSPDGQRIAFMSTRDGNSEIYVMSADGSNPTNLTQDVGDDYNPAWSPDGQRIAFMSTRDGNSEIYVMSADGSNPTNLTQDVGDDYNPAWSPDGQRIAFMSNRDENSSEIYVIDVE